jgi:hypothetical protein
MTPEERALLLLVADHLASSFSREGIWEYPNEIRRAIRAVTEQDHGKCDTGADVPGGGAA